jgi:hypothetical protein
MLQAMKDQPAISIPNSTSNSEGLLPWLFGGTQTTPEQADGPQALPDNVPFQIQVQDDADAIHTATEPEQLGTIGHAPVMEDAPVRNMPREAVKAAQPKNEDDDDKDVLTPGFWKSLGVPENAKVEYTYPGQDKRRR